jgi:DNA-binding NarL/FixJ family response regulator
MEAKIKVSVVDDHEFFKSGVVLALKRLKFVSLVYTAFDGLDFIEKQRKSPADIVLLDISMPRLDGYNALLQVKKEFPGIKVIVLTASDNDEQIERFFNAGINGYLLKNIDQHELEAALQALIQGELYYSKELMSYFMRRLKTGKDNEEIRNKLSKREMEIFQLIYDGYSNQEIAEKLFISVRTVTNHRHNLKMKTATKNTAGMISFGLKNKLIH